MKIKGSKMFLGVSLIIFGGILQNIFWSLRLRNPFLMREFKMYFAEEGAKVFMSFNVINYFFITISLILFVIYYYLENKNANSVKSEEEGK